MDEHADTTDATISRIERARFLPSQDLLDRLGAALDVDPSELVVSTHKHKKAALRSCEARLLAVVRGMDAASEYLTTHPTSVACAIEGAVAEHGDDAGIDHVMERLVPPLLPWAREVKGFSLSDFATPVYPTPLNPND